MRVALIPPADLLYTIMQEDLHMVIPEGLHSVVYKGFYEVIGRRESTTIMLDNGAFEAEGAVTGLGFEQMVGMIYDLNVDIFCLPDKIGSHHLTVEAAEKFLHQWELMHTSKLKLPKSIKFMAILQGSDASELRQCFWDYVAMEEEFETSLMIGLPRWMTEEIYKQVRFDAVEFISRTAPHSMHLLGLSRAWPEELKQYRDYPHVVSVDTSAPYVWSAAGARLGMQDGVERMENYFTHDSRSIDEQLILDNVDTLKGWANGD